MANATERVKNRTIDNTGGQFLERSTETLAAETRFYTNAMIGVDSTGYYCKADDTQGWVFAGVVRGREGDPKLPAGTAGDGTMELNVHRPCFLECGIASVAVTDIGKKVYALFDQTVTLDTSATTFGNLVGTIQWVEPNVTTKCWVKPNYDGVAGQIGAARVLPATGTQTLTKMDLNKTIIITNTGAQTINLPAVAGTQANDRLTFVKTSSAAFAATLDGDGSETIDNSTTLATIDAQYDTAILFSTGTEWVVLARDIA